MRFYRKMVDYPIATPYKWSNQGFPEAPDSLAYNYTSHKVAP